MSDLVTDVIAELIAKWNTSTISMPAFYRGTLSDPKNQTPYGTVTLDGDAVHKRATFQGTSIIKTPFGIQMVTAKIADAELTYAETRRIIKAKTVTAGWWECISHDIMEINEHHTQILMKCQQTQWVA